VRKRRTQVAEEQSDNMSMSTAEQTQIIKYARTERNIIEIGFFTPSNRKLKEPKRTVLLKSINGQLAELSATIVPAVTHGLPTIAHQDKWIAFQILVNQVKARQGVITNPFTFTSDELLKILGLTDSGTNYKLIEEWLDVMFDTSIHSDGAIYLADSKIRKYGKERIRVFDRVVTMGQKLESGEFADKHYIWFSEWQLGNINSGISYLDFNHNRYTNLHTDIAKALVPHLQNWFYVAKRSDGIYTKRYDSLCQLLRLTQYQYLSKIIEKLKPALEELLRENFLGGWEVKKTSVEEGYKMVFYDPELYETSDGAIEKKVVDRVGDNTTQPDTASPNELWDEEELLHPEDKPILTPEQQLTVNQLMNEFRIIRSKAEELVLAKLEQTREQLAAWQYRDHSQIKGKAAWLIRAIEQDYELPPDYIELQQQQLAESERQRLELLKRTCSFCNGIGFYYMADRTVRRCTHTPDIETAKSSGV
jgi:hypothetical protein